MRIILTVSDQVWGGKHRYMHDTALGLARAGHTVTVLAEDGGAMLAAGRSAGLDTVGLPPYASEPDACAAAVAAVFQEQRPHVVCATGRSDASAVKDVMAAGADADPVFVLFRHSAFPLGTTDEVRDLFEEVDLVFATSREQRQRQFQPLVSAGILADNQVEVLTSGVGESLLKDLAAADREEARRELRIPPDGFAFLVLARLAWEKGVDRVIDALAAMDSADSVPRLLVVAGDGPLKAELCAQAEDRGVADQVRFVGHRTDVARLIVACDAMVLASTVPETGPLALKEAMAAGRPVIAAAQGGIPEFVEDEKNGLLIVDDEDLCSAMERIAADAELATAMGRHGAQTVHGGHRAERRAEYLVHRLDLLALDRTPPEPVLAELSWDDVRLRAEADGGFVFVPRTSQLMELDDAGTFAVVRAAVAAGDPRLLLEPAVPAAAQLPPHRLASRLYSMGALVRPGPTAATAPPGRV